MLLSSLTTLIVCTASFGGLVGASPARYNQPRADGKNAAVTPQGNLRLGAVPSKGGFKEGLLSLERTYRKYGAALPPRLGDAIKGLKEGKTSAQLIEHTEISKKVSSRDTGAVEATPANEYDTFYASTLEVGSPPQAIPVLLDTGSSDFWLFSSETPPEQVAGNKIYDIEASSTSEKLSGASWDIQYVDGSRAAGDVYTDVVSAGGLAVGKQAIGSVVEAAENQAEQLEPASGIVGLGFSVLNTITPEPQKTFWENALPNLTEPLFTVNFKLGETGSINFGEIDESEFSGNITYVPLTEAKWWDVVVEGFAVGNGETVSSRYVGAVDTGTTVLVIQDEVVDAYVAKLSTWELNTDYGLLLYLCEEELPDLTLVFGGHEALIPGELLYFQQLNQDVCAMAMLPSSVFGLEEGILGGPLFRSQFVVFHGGDEKVGFANKA